MAAYYYVKSDGTATGDAGRYASKQTGTFAALGTTNYYVSINAALSATTPPVSGDFIVCSHLYDFDGGGSTLTHACPTGAGLTIISVDDTAIDAYLVGAKEQTNGAITTTGNAKYIGFEHDTANAINAGGNSSAIYVDSTLVLSSGSDYVGAVADGAIVEVINSTVSCANATNGIRVQNGAMAVFRSTAFTGVNLTNLVLTGSFANAGGCASFYGCDVSIVTGTLNGDGSAQGVDDRIEVILDMCELDSGVASSVDFANYNQFFKMTRSSDVSAGHDYQFNLKTLSGEASDNTSVTRDEDDAFAESGQRISYEIVTSTECNQATPFVMDFPNLRYAELSSVSSDTLRLFLTTNTTLTDNEFYVELAYPDGTSKNVTNSISSQNADYFAVGTTLTTDSSSTWTGGLSNDYQIDLSTSGDVGTDSVPHVRVYISKPSVTVHMAAIMEVN